MAWTSGPANHAAMRAAAEDLGQTRQDLRARWQSDGVGLWKGLSSRPPVRGRGSPLALASFVPHRRPRSFVEAIS